jgi:protease IV
MHNQPHPTPEPTTNQPAPSHQPYTYIPPPKKPNEPISSVKHFWLTFAAVVAGIPAAFVAGFALLFIFGVFLAVLFGSGGSTSTDVSNVKMDYIYGKKDSSHKLASVPIRGVILSGSGADPLKSIFGEGFTDGEQVKETLRSLADDKSVDGVIFEIDSPGGMITASKAIADGVEYFRSVSKKPIISHINGTGASGAYWSASATDAIYAEQGSEAGSVGVIMGPLVTTKGITGYGGITTSEPITFKYFTAGRSKDLGSQFRDITPDEEAFINKQIQAEYEKFVAHVSTRRGIPADTIKTEIGALAYGTDDATRLKLIDGTMSKEQAFDELAGRAKVKDDFQVMRVSSQSSYISSLFGASSFIGNIKMTSADKSAARTRFCETNLLGRPLVYEGDPSSLCK